MLHHADSPDLLAELAGLAGEDEPGADDDTAPPDPGARTRWAEIRRASLAGSACGRGR